MMVVIFVNESYVSRTTHDSTGGCRNSCSSHMNIPPHANTASSEHREPRKDGEVRSGWTSRKRSICKSALRIVILARPRWRVLVGAYQQPEGVSSLARSRRFFRPQRPRGGICLWWSGGVRLGSLFGPRSRYFLERVRGRDSERNYFYTTRRLPLYCSAAVVHQSACCECRSRGRRPPRECGGVKKNVYVFQHKFSKNAVSE